MLGIFGQKSGFEDVSDSAVVFSRWTHDEDPAESYPVVILFDSEAAGRAHTRGLTHIAVVTAGFSDEAIIRDQMPDGALIMQLRAALDQAFTDICAKMKVKANLLATQTGGGARHYFLLTDDVEKVRNAVLTVTAPRSISLNVWKRDDLPSLVGWLEPSRLESWTLRDDELRSVFAERGDDGVGPRDTRFFFHGGDQQALGEAVIQAGFKREPSQGVTTASRDMPITADEMNPLNVVFSEWVDAFGVDYDGWEAALLVKN